MTNEERQARRNAYLFPCSVCGRNVDLSIYSPRSKRFETMSTRKMCNTCALWEELLRDIPPDTYIIKGVAYTYAMPDEDEVGVKPKEARYYIITIDGLKPLRFKERRKIGRVPDFFRPYLPDNAWEVSYGIFRRAYREQGCDCQMKGCYDRYHCLWYHPETTEAYGPWNTVPKDIEPGWENCPSFIDKDKL